MHKIVSDNIRIYSYKVYRKDKAPCTEPVARTITRESAKILRDGFNKRFN